MERKKEKLPKMSLLKGSNSNCNSRLKVYYKWPPSDGGTVPLIMLQGEWLRSSGFDIGDEVLVTVETNRLTIDFEKRKED
ncbi:SymE family type I addiction module toxin [Pedobacter sp. Du54]|uniref:SymE family type I addiction module toxin n=1 Tax=Pedobacter anseongensis TaxID=3133439 RepID=UPI0030A0C1B5